MDEDSGRWAAEQDEQGIRIQAIVAEVARHVDADERQLLPKLERHRPRPSARCASR
jgi:hypothetical protein